MALDQLSRDWTDAKREQADEIREAMRRHRERTARHPTRTRREHEDDQARRAGLLLAWSAIGLLVLVVAATFWLVHCPGLQAIGC